MEAATMILVNEIIDVAAISTLGGLIYLKKDIFDSKEMLVKFPFLNNLAMRILFIVAACSIVVLVFMPIYQKEAILLFFSSVGIGLGFFTVLHRRHTSLVDVQYTNDSVKFVDSTVFLEIPTDKYVQVAVDTFDRQIKNAVDIFDEAEARYKTLISTIDFSRHIVVFCQFGEDAKFPEHRHSLEEKFYMLEGEVEMFEGVSVKAGEEITIPKNKPHHFFGVASGCCIITLKIK